MCGGVTMWHNDSSINFLVLINLIEVMILRQYCSGVWHHLQHFYLSTNVLFLIFMIWLAAAARQ